MRQIVLDGSSWKCDGCFYNGFFEAMGLPESHAQALDALRDAIVAGGITHIEVNGVSKMKPAAKEIVERFVTLIAQAKAEDHPVDIVCNP